MTERNHRLSEEKIGNLASVFYMSSELKNWIREVSQNPDLKDESILIRKGPEGNTLISIFHGKCCVPSISISKSLSDIEKTDIESHKETLIHQHR